jgi:signal peptide peptidase SppA
MHGVMEGAKPGYFTFKGTGFATEPIIQRIKTAAIDDAVDEVVLDLNSPGGAVEGVPELVAELRRFNRVKATTAFINYQAGSAAWWVASQCDRVVCCPSGQVGSIGVYLQHQDMSGAYDKALISAGKYKVEGNHLSALGKDARAYAQYQVDQIYDEFVADVARGREVSRAAVLHDMGQGRMLNAADAKKAGMVDYVAADLDAVPSNAAIALKQLAHAERIWRLS